MRSISIVMCAIALFAVCADASCAPRAAVARVIVQERGAVSFGSGTLIDCRDRYGLVVTNWHVVRDAEGKIEVVFPDGFRSQARAAKLDEDWDLAALVIWRPNTAPIKIADRPPRPGDPLTICGYGQGEYREATGRCTDFYAPEVGFPHELVELSVEARQGDSGGPILNQSGEMAGVLFGAGQGATLGSFAPRVGTFLASLAPDLGKPDAEGGLPATPPLIAHSAPGAQQGRQTAAGASWISLEGPQELTACGQCQSCCCPDGQTESLPAASVARRDSFAPWQASDGDRREPEQPTLEENPSATDQSREATALDSPTSLPLWFSTVRDLLAILGLVFVSLQVIKAAA